MLNLAPGTYEISVCCVNYNDSYIGTIYEDRYGIYIAFEFESLIYIVEG